MKKKSFIIACGGTGGHLSPGIALAERLTEKGFHCTLLVSKKKIDTRLAGKYASLEFMQAPGCAFSLSPKGFFKFLFNFQSEIFDEIYETKKMFHPLYPNEGFTI